MFDWEMIRACAELYPIEFYSLCALMAVIIPIGAILMVAMAMIVVEDEGWKRSGQQRHKLSGGSCL